MSEIKGGQVWRDVFGDDVLVIEDDGLYNVVSLKGVFVPKFEVVLLNPVKDGVLLGDADLEYKLADSLSEYYKKVGE